MELGREKNQNKPPVTAYTYGRDYVETPNCVINNMFIPFPGEFCYWQKNEGSYLSLCNAR